MRSRRLVRKSFVKTARSMISSNRGFSLMEIMVTVGVLSIVALGTSVLFSDMFTIQKRGNTIQAIQTMRTEIIAAVTRTDLVAPGPGVVHTSAWAAIVADTANDHATDPTLGMQCIRNNTPCRKDALYPLNVRGVREAEIFSSRVTTRGFRMDGQLCNTFSTSTPDPMCPFRWDISLRTRCVGTNKTQCENPLVEIDGTLLYSPGSNDPMGGPLNLAQYAFNVRRGDKPDLNQPFSLAYITDVPVLAGVATAGEPTATCYNTWRPRQFNTVTSNPANVVTLYPPTEFELKIGSYDCRIQVPAFKNGDNRIRLVRRVGVMSTVVVTSGPASASMNGGSATVTLQANFTTNVDARFRVEHFCTETPADDKFILGVPVKMDGGSYNGVTFSVLSCIKTS